MIYLIGGPPRAGKTKLATALAREKNVPYFSLDHVTSVITPYIPESEWKNKLPLSVARHETEYSNDAFYRKYAVEEIVTLYEKQAFTYWPGVQGFIKYAVEDNHDLILEGWQLLPNLVRTVLTPENRETLRIIFLHKSEVSDIVTGLKSSKTTNDWVIKNTKEERTFVAIAMMLSKFGNHIEAEAGKAGFLVVNTDREFEDRLRAIVIRHEF